MIKRVFVVILVVLSTCLCACQSNEITYGRDYYTHSVSESFSLDLLDLGVGVDTSVLEEVTTYLSNIGYTISSSTDDSITIRRTYTYQEYNDTHPYLDVQYEYSLFSIVTTTRTSIRESTIFNEDFNTYFTSVLASRGLSDVEISRISCTYVYTTDYQSITSNCHQLSSEGDRYIHTWRYTLADVDESDIIIIRTSPNTLTYYILLTVLGLATFLISCLIMNKLRRTKWNNLE